MSELSMGEVLLMHGCTENQMGGMESILAALEREFTGLHLNIIALRALAHCQEPEKLERYADTIAFSSGALLDALRKERDSIAGLVGKKQK